MEAKLFTMLRMNLHISPSGISGHHCDLREDQTGLGPHYVEVFCNYEMPVQRSFHKGHLSPLPLSLQSKGPMRVAHWADE